MAASRSRLESWAPWLLSAVVLVVWQLVRWAFDISDFIFPSPVQVARSLVEYAGPIAGHAWKTFWTTMAGFAIGVAVGVLLGVIVGSSRFIGIGPNIAMAFAICFFPIVVNVATGLATLEPELDDVLRALGATRLDVLTKVGLPRSLPYFFASLKVAITLAFVGTVVSETVASNDGIGYLMMSAGSSMRMPLVFAGLFVIGVMAMAMYELFAVLERRMTGWAHRGQAAAT